MWEHSQRKEWPLPCLLWPQNPSSLKKRLNLDILLIPQNLASVSKGCVSRSSAPLGHLTSQPHLLDIGLHIKITQNEIQELSQSGWSSSSHKAASNGPGWGQPSLTQQCEGQLEHGELCCHRKCWQIALHLWLDHGLCVESELARKPLTSLVKQPADCFGQYELCQYFLKAEHF